MTIAYPCPVFAHHKNHYHSTLVGFWNMPPDKQAWIVFILAVLLLLAGQFIGSMYGA